MGSIWFKRDILRIVKKIYELKKNHVHQKIYWKLFVLYVYKLF